MTTDPRMTQQATCSQVHTVRRAVSGARAIPRQPSMTDVSIDESFIYPSQASENAHRASRNTQSWHRPSIRHDFAEAGPSSRPYPNCNESTSGSVHEGTHGPHYQPIQALQVDRISRSDLPLRSLQWNSQDPTRRRDRLISPTRHVGQDGMSPPRSLNSSSRPSIVVSALSDAGRVSSSFSDTTTQREAHRQCGLKLRERVGKNLRQMQCFPTSWVEKIAKVTKVNPKRQGDQLSEKHSRPSLENAARAPLERRPTVSRYGGSRLWEAAAERDFGRGRVSSPRHYQPDTASRRSGDGSIYAETEDRIPRMEGTPSLRQSEDISRLLVDRPEFVRPLLNARSSNSIRRIWQETLTRDSGYSDTIHRSSTPPAREIDHPEPQPNFSGLPIVNDNTLVPIWQRPESTPPSQEQATSEGRPPSEIDPPHSTRSIAATSTSDVPSPSHTHLSTKAEVGEKAPMVRSGSKSGKAPPFLVRDENPRDRKRLSQAVSEFSIDSSALLNLGPGPEPDADLDCIETQIQLFKHTQLVDIKVLEHESPGFRSRMICTNLLIARTDLERLMSTWNMAFEFLFDKLIGELRDIDWVSNHIGNKLVMNMEKAIDHYQRWEKEVSKLRENGPLPPLASNKRPIPGIHRDWNEFDAVLAETEVPEISLLRDQLVRFAQRLQDVKNSLPNRYEAEIQFFNSKRSSRIDASWKIALPEPKQSTPGSSSKSCSLPSIAKEYWRIDTPGSVEEHGAVRRRNAQRRPELPEAWIQSDQSKDPLSVQSQNAVRLGDSWKTSHSSSEFNPSLIDSTTATIHCPTESNVSSAAGQDWRTRAMTASKTATKFPIATPERRRAAQESMLSDSTTLSRSTAGASKFSTHPRRRAEESGASGPFSPFRQGRVSEASRSRAIGPTASSSARAASSLPARHFKHHTLLREPSTGGSSQHTPPKSTPKRASHPAAQPTPQQPQTLPSSSNLSGQAQSPSAIPGRKRQSRIPTPSSPPASGNRNSGLDSASWPRDTVSNPSSGPPIPPRTSSVALIPAPLNVVNKRVSGGAQHSRFSLPARPAPTSFSNVGPVRGSRASASSSLPRPVRHLSCPVVDNASAGGTRRVRFQPASENIVIEPESEPGMSTELGSRDEDIEENDQGEGTEKGKGKGKGKEKAVDKRDDGTSLALNDAAAGNAEEEENI